MKNRLHLKAPGNWINDPNGFIYYKGEYHLFYQYFPYAPQWGTMHWGHAVSRDLISWEHKGIALFPSRREDQNGCFSGTAVSAEGRLFLFYTGVHYLQPDPENIHQCVDNQFEACQLMISSEDGERFDNFNGKQVVVPRIDDPRIGDGTHTRDPKVWRGKDGWYLMLASCLERKRGELLFYKSQDLYHWSLVSRTEKGEEFGWMWECPDYFQEKGQDFLLISLMGIGNRLGCQSDQSVWMPVDFCEENCRMQLPDVYQYVDWGRDLYAPQTTLDAQGRRVMVAWMRMPKAVEGRWRGMFCLPRLVENRGGRLCFPVHPDVDAAYCIPVSSWEDWKGDNRKLSMTMEEGELLDLGGFQIFRSGGRIGTDRSRVTGGDGWMESFPLRCETPKLEGQARLDIYVEPNLIEVYVNHGEYVISNVVYALKQGLERRGGSGPLEIFSADQLDA